MKKTALALLISTCLFNISYSQLKVAIVGGAQQSTVVQDSSSDYTGRIGGHFGFVADLPFSVKSHVSFQPGVVFYMKGQKYSRQFDETTNVVIRKTATQYVNYIDIPLNLVLKFGSKTKFIIGAGPYLSFFYNGKETSADYTLTGISQSDDNDDLPIGKKPGQYRVINYGVNGLIGFETGRFFLTANYSRGLNDFYQLADYDGDYKHQVIGGTIGIFLGKGVEVEKKVKDKDHDGILDADDECPTEAGTALTYGCPDTDGDGIADKNDKCPVEAGTARLLGCPIRDKDGDGISDRDDKCPDIAGLARYGGCPIPDADKDAINDEEDKCPNVAGLARYEGCPIPDTDGDGVNDEEDKCPTVKGTAERNGCPTQEIKKEIIEKVNYAARRIQFQFGRRDLQQSSFPVLDEVVKILKESPQLKIAIEGHTSADGSAEANNKLSQARATTVRDYLESKGIEASRLSAKGFGGTQPLNHGKTEAEKSQNRRVELKLSN